METKYRTLERQNFAINPTDQFEYPDLQKLGAPHINSFNRIFESAGKGMPPLIDLAVKEIGETTIYDYNENYVGSKLGNKLTYWIEDVQLHRPSNPSYDGNKTDFLSYPAECRERKSTYRGKLTCKLGWRLNDDEPFLETKSLGFVPIMVRSNRCNLEGMGPRDLIKHHEDGEDFGGYFVVNGGEKIIRLLISPKRNHVTAIKRRSYANRGPSFTEFAVQINCVRPDQSSTTSTLHYLINGDLMFRFTWYKQEFLVPVSLILKAVSGASDKDIFENLVQCDLADTFFKDQIELLILSVKKYKVHSKEQALRYIGAKFRIVMGLPEDTDDLDVGILLVNKVVMVHLSNWNDKYNMLIFMIRKLYALVSGKCQADNPDSLQNQEVYMPGFLYLNIIKEKIQDILTAIRTQVTMDLRKNPEIVKFTDINYISKMLKRVPMDVGMKLQYFLATGNLVSKTGMNLQQTTGFTIVAEKLNFLRYISHFQCIHRGSFFAQLKTTAVRKLLPEGWGFLCPVHTPDGSPCGLLNHLAHKCEITTNIESVKDVEKCLLDLGVSFGLPSPYLVAETILKRSHQSKNKSSLKTSDPDFDYVTVQMDGRILGFCTVAQAGEIAKKLRLFKIQSINAKKGEYRYNIPHTLEIGYVPKLDNGQFPGLYIFSNPARFVRPVRHLASDKIDYVGSFEQVYMEIACLNEDIRPGSTEYMEIQPTHILSSVANMTPFCDFNQSPRNMYQCQMGKQSMGTPAQALKHRADNKLYWLQSGQTPVVRPALYDKFGVDGYPNGMNAVVAVLSYTGYDMEDAMILNKSGLERGFGYGSIYKTEVFDLTESRNRSGVISKHFMLGPDVIDEKVLKNIDKDGLPFIGTPLVEGDPVIAVYNDVNNSTNVKKYKGEPCYVDTVRLVNTDGHAFGDPELQMVQITYRIPRSPVIGDKFSSRHGQKGVNSIRFPAIDLPFTESGMQPDVIINPHAFPSRMTIGMFVESLAGKTGALYGVAQDATPFQFNEDHTAADFFGEQLLASGYNYHGNEPMYSGITGEEMSADIYVGVVYYQRLRHMVNDKYQVRTTGPIDSLTHQPIKGRKKGGGIRLGEMERDSLLAHGTSYILQDRLMNSSDYSRAYVCKCCGSLIAPIATPTTNHVDLEIKKDEMIDEESLLYRSTKPWKNSSEDKTWEMKRATDAAMSMSNARYGSRTRLDLNCRVCKSSEITVVAIPYVLRYLTTELACMNIKVNLTVR
ncbi:putative DNA-directed RNA polymerase I subunit RPA2 [Smittium mucronatum]|uniref:DNA-directed RNA polymerase subunit beta n=1 Tax=Smittium mucronatum TaxID=133383 RepID=A0A1R0H0G1_9FUNG|nr:putative DNA-directed RNA polymerase I subunit RPA2 [Smittium mucronatum]